ncbi:MAG: hypothetical protein LDL09_02300 [Calditerrivibrio sp.]|nr:hypothetical protein [Calditerrivibrio sp.]
MAIGSKTIKKPFNLFLYKEKCNFISSDTDANIKGTNLIVWYCMIKIVEGGINNLKGYNSKLETLARSNFFVVITKIKE